MRKIFFTFLLLACTLVFCERPVFAVQVTGGPSDSPSYSNFYIYNNTAANILSGGNFGFSLPSVQDYSIAAHSKLEIMVQKYNQGTQIYTIQDPSGATYTFGLWGYTGNKGAEQWAQWRLTNGGDPSWNQTNGAQSPSGVYTIIDEGGQIEQLWNDNYVVTIMSNPQDEDKDPPVGQAWIIIVITPNTTSANFFQSGTNGIGPEWQAWDFP